jgi:O-antigen/teichoic acid export membrane protein
LAGSQEPARTNPILLLRQTLPFLGLALAEVLLQRLDILLLSVVAGPAVTGLYSAAYNVVRVAMKLIQSFWRALYPTLSRLQHRSTEQYERLQALSLRFGLLALLLAAAVGFGAAAELLGWMLGDEYAAAGAVLRCLVWAIPLFLFEAYALTTLMIERQLRASLWISVLHIGALLGLLPPLAVLGGAVGAGIAVSLAGAVGTTAGLLLLRRPVAGIGQPGLWLAAGVAGTLAALAPFDWRLNALLAVCAYGILCWGTGVLTPNDLQALRRLLSNREH